MTTERLAANVRVGVTPDLALAAGETLTPVQLLGGVTVALGVWLNHRASAGVRARRAENSLAPLAID